MSKHDRDGGSVFQIGSQQAGQINNIGRDQTVYGGQRAGASFAGVEPLREVERLREALAGSGLDAPTRRAATRSLDEVEEELERDSPDRQKVAGGLERLTETFTRAGSLAKAGVELAGPLRQLAIWLGPLGKTVLAMVPLLFP